MGAFAKIAKSNIAIPAKKSNKKNLGRRQMRIAEILPFISFRIFDGISTYNLEVKSQRDLTYLICGAPNISKNLCNLFISIQVQ